MAMKPSAASWSTTERAQSLRPKISWITSTTGALSLRSGYTTQASNRSPLPASTTTHSPCRGDFARRSIAAASAGGIPD